MNRTARLAAVSLMSVAVAMPALPAAANDADVIDRGRCSGHTVWKLKASPENGRIEVEAQIDSNRAGQTWTWRLLHNGSLSARGSSVTKAPSGSFTVRRVVLNAAGRDYLTFRSANTRSGESCVGRVSF